MSSLLPDDQRDRRNLSRQDEASHRRLHPFCEQLQVEILERSFPAAGHGGRTLKDGFHIMIVVLVKPAQLLWLLGTSCRHENSAVRPTEWIAGNPSVIR